MNELKRYFEIAERLRLGQEVPKEDTQFFLQYSPEIDEKSVDEFIAKGGAGMTKEQAANAALEAGKALQSNPQYKQQVLDIAKSAEKGRISDKLSAGVNLILAGSDIAQSINQIQASKGAANRSKRPSRPLVPQRDQFLQQALRQANVGTMEAGKSLAPAQAQIQDQYLSDIQGAKTASTGQAGAYGAYRQLAANRRNRAALELAPMQDEIRRGQQGRYDQLLGQRLGETQNMFQNQNDLYGQDLGQYNQDQQAIASLGARGHSNLRNSVMNLGSQIPNIASQAYVNNKYNKLKNNMNMYSPQAGDIAVKNQQYLDRVMNPNYNEQMYIGE